MCKQTSQPQENSQECISQQIRGVMIREFYRKEWLYVGLVDTDWRNREGEEEYFRCDGAVDALMELARQRGLEDEVLGELHPEEAGKQRLRQYILERQQNGPSRLEELWAEIERIQRETSVYEHPRDHAERVKRGYFDLQGEKLAIEGDLEIVDLTLRYLDGEDIELG